MENTKTYELAGIKWIALEEVKDGVLCIAESILEYRAFDEENCNDWKKSSLRKYANGEFLQKLEAELGTDAIMPFTQDLTTDDGLKDYGSSTDKVFLLTADQYRKHRSKIKEQEDWWWLITAYTTNSFNVRGVYASGALFNGNAYGGYYGFLPACVFKSQILNGWEEKEENKEDKEKQAAEEKRMLEVEKFKGYYANIKRNGAGKMLEWLEEKGFFTAPASTKYHGCYTGGLVEHTNNVFERLLQLSTSEDERLKREQPEYTLETIAIVSLLHDVCKTDAYKIETKNQKQKDGSWKQVKSYTYTNAFPVGHGEKSVFQIMRFMELSDEELMAIRWHMGAFDSAAKGGSYDMNNAFAESRLAAMLHLADMMATHLDEREEKEKDV